MKAKEVEIGSRVSSQWDKGTIVGNHHKDGDEVVVVEWDGGDIGKSNINDIKVLPAKSFDDIEKAYQDVKAIYEKADAQIKSAQGDLKEANDIAKEHGIDLVDHVKKLTVIGLLNEMESAGWSHSSLLC